MVFSWVCIPCRLTALVTAVVHYGLGLDLFDIDDPNNQINAIKYLTIAPNFSILSVAAGKVSIVLLIQHDHGPIGKEAVFSYHCSSHNLGELPEQKAAPYRVQYGKEGSKPPGEEHEILREISFSGNRMYGG